MEWNFTKTLLLQRNTKCTLWNFKSTSAISKFLPHPPPAPLLLQNMHFQRHSNSKAWDCIVLQHVHFLISTKTARVCTQLSYKRNKNISQQESLLSFPTFSPQIFFYIFNLNFLHFLKISGCCLSKVFSLAYCLLNWPFLAPYY